MANQPVADRFLKACGIGLTWQLLPCVASTFAAFTWSIGRVYPWMILAVIVTALVAGKVHRSTLVGWITLLLPIAIFGVIFLAFLLIVYVPPGQHP